MNFQSTITPTVTIADQPTRTDLEQLKELGFKAVVNLRNDGEPEQPIGTAEEGRLVTALGLDYLHVGVGPGLTSDGVDAFRSFMDKHDADKVLVHCRKGGRAAAMVLYHEAKKNGWSKDEAFDKGPRMGLSVDGGMKALVERLLDS